MVSAFFPRIKAYLFGAAAFVLAFVGVYFAGRRDGKSAAKADAAEEIFDDIRQAREIENAVKAMDRDSLVDAGREWVRKGDD